MTKKMQSYSTEFKAEAIKKIADNNSNQGKLVGTEQYDPELMTA